MTVERMAAAIGVLTQFMATLNDMETHLSEEALLEVILHGLKIENPDALAMAELIENVVAAYMGGGVERHGRALIEAVAETDKAKRLRMNVLTGPGVGPWECIIRRDRAVKRPAIILPGSSKEWN